METLLLKTKRKKRKTRKCLDELRKKSRNCFTNLVSIPTNLEKRQERCINIIKPIHITSNLLKCNMLKKVVHSETVTRSVLPKNKCGDIIQYVNMKSVIKKSSDNDILHPVTVCNNDHDGNSISQELGNNLNDSDGDSSDSLILFSHFSNENSSHEDTNAPSQSIENNGYRLYEEFMDSLPMFIQRNFNNLIKDDNIVEETKEGLQNLSINYARHKLKNKMYIMDKMSSSVIKEAVVQNPMDYIRFGTMLQGNFYKCKEPPSNEDTSSMSDYEDSPSVQNFQSILSKTPEYNYFPHKLN